DPGQTMSVLVTPTAAGLQPMVTLLDPFGSAIGTATAGAAGQKALLQATATPSGGTYSIVVGSAGGTTGAYTVQVTLNAALENEGNVPGSTNNTGATEQDLSGSFVTLQTPQTTAQRGAVSGGFTDGDNDFYAFNLTAGQIVTLGLVASPLGNALFGTRTDVSA